MRHKLHYILTAFLFFFIFLFVVILQVAKSFGVKLRGLVQELTLEKLVLGC